MGPISFLHGQETCLDFSLGVLSGYMFVVVIGVNFIGPVLMQNLKAEGMFMTFGILTAVFLAYIIFFVKDTTYKTEIYQNKIEPHIFNQNIDMEQDII